jgi:hypothetical protein
MKALNQNNESGFIALISAIVISLILVTITVILNLTGFFGRYNIVDSEFKQISTGLAEACVDTAILEVTKGNTPAANTVIPVGANNCTIVSVNTFTRTIQTKAIYQKSHTNLKISYSPTFAITSWQECPTDNPASCI